MSIALANRAIKRRDWWRKTHGGSSAGVKVSSASTKSQRDILVAFCSELDELRSQRPLARACPGAPPQLLNAARRYVRARGVHVHEVTQEKLRAVLDQLGMYTVSADDKADIGTSATSQSFVLPSSTPVSPELGARLLSLESKLDVFLSRLQERDSAVARDAGTAFLRPYLPSVPPLVMNQAIQTKYVVVEVPRLLASEKNTEMSSTVVKGKSSDGKEKRSVAEEVQEQSYSLWFDDVCEKKVEVVAETVVAVEPVVTKFENDKKAFHARKLAEAEARATEKKRTVDKEKNEAEEKRTVAKEENTSDNGKSTDEKGKKTVAVEKRSVSEQKEQLRKLYDSTQEALKVKRSSGTATAEDYENLAVLADGCGNGGTAANLRHNARLIFRHQK